MDNIYQVPDMRSLEIERMRLRHAAAREAFHGVMEALAAGAAVPKKTAEAAYRWAREAMAVGIKPEEPAGRAEVKTIEVVEAGGLSPDNIEEPHLVDEEDPLIRQDFKNRGEFYTAALKLLNWNKSTADPMLPNMNLDDERQRQAAWEELVRRYREEHPLRKEK